MTDIPNASGSGRGGGRSGNRRGGGNNGRGRNTGTHINMGDGQGWGIVASGEDNQRSNQRQHHGYYANQGGRKNNTKPNRIDGIDNLGDNPPQQNGDVLNEGNRKRRNEVERVGPVFGFKRIHGFLSSSTEDVIMSIGRDKKDWERLLQSNDLTLKSSDVMYVILEVLAEKICQETIILKNQQAAILIATTCPNFAQKLNSICSDIFIGRGETGIGNQRRIQNSGLISVDKSPAVFLKNLHAYCEFALKVIPKLTVDYLQSVVTQAFGAITTREAMESITPGVTSGAFSELKQCYQALFTAIQTEVQRVVQKESVNSILKKDKSYGMTADEEDELHKMEAPDNFRDISVVPSVQELRSREEVFLRPNKKTGAYNDANHYLDVQFRLLREDFVRPLKNGVQDFLKHKFEYMSRKKKIPLGSAIRIYPDVQIVSSELVGDAFVYKVQLPEESYKKIKWEKSKRLLTGSLLVFTPGPDFFKTAYFATLHSRKTDELAKGIASIVWESRPPVWDRDDEYLMVECEVYFEAFRHTLHILQQLELQDFPLCKFIVEASSEVHAPKYLENAEHFMKIQLASGIEKFFSPLLLQQWPTSEDLGLDTNQFTAFQAAITKEFAIIQGPPGTGKTFLGLKIAELFLNNVEVWAGDPETKGPILVVCYTNHALDQFMEGILTIFDKMGTTDPSIVRVGGRCKSEKLNHYSLQNVVRRKRREMPKHYWPNFYEIQNSIEDLRNQRARIMDAVMALRDIQGIIDFEKLDAWSELEIEFPSGLWKCFASASWFGLQENNFTSINFDEENLLRRSFEIRLHSRGKKVKKVDKSSGLHNGTEPQLVEDNSADDEDYDLDELMENRILDDIFIESEIKALTSINVGKYLSYVEGLSVKDDENSVRRIERIASSTRDVSKNALPPAAAVQNLTRLHNQITVHKNRRCFLDKLFYYYKNDQIDLPDVTTKIAIYKSLPADLVAENVRALPQAERWAMYFAIVERARELSALKVSEIEGELRRQQKEQKEARLYGDGFILQNSAVVGMTTTGAAKYNDLVKMMRSKIVICEEAAEVLEAHIVTCITKACEHLILIGDHRQLRPSTTVYDLSTKFNLDISLFERMINNQLNCYQLKVQHRMRPEIANLVVGTIYEELENFPNVYLYPSVKGVRKNLFFIEHTHLEKGDSDSMSKSNLFEAQFMASLCRYLVLQGYQSDQITILTTYTGQMFLLKNEVKNFAHCRGVRITCVDNYQGEECDIILLSLVRSNMESKIGFISTDNRICVSLSRARHGMYIVGNMDMLTKKSKTWTAIREKLEERGECGPGLSLECQIHETISIVSSSEDIRKKAPEGGCNLICDAILGCTHHCQKLCHATDREHTNIQCMQACLKICTTNQPPHPCVFPCFRKCPPCRQSVMRILPCQHEKQLECFEKPEEVLCEVVVLKKLPCGHEERMPCHRDESKYKCKIQVEKELPCSHKRVVQCHVDAAELTCKIMVEKDLPCGHKQMAECRFLPSIITCRNIIEILLDACGHKMQVECNQKNKPVNCKNQCTIRLNCGHACTKVCHITEDPMHLNYLCKKECSKPCKEGHTCTGKHLCHKPCPPCIVQEKKTLSCGHVKELECHVDSQSYDCLMSCEKILDCRHKCGSLCFQECGPCQIKVKKRNFDCKHPIEIECSVRPTKDHCNILVDPIQKSLCEHNTRVPCRISQIATPRQIMNICNQPCGARLQGEVGSCGHSCKGNCSSCTQGTFHVKCQEECGKQLVCGHVCNFPCSQTCPPCKKNCLMKCEHSECKKKCGMPCNDCNEPCPWQCKHKKCTRLCREPCDREPCDEPCPKMIPGCGHPCIGFCGEPCPPKCRICDKEEVTEIFLGNEEDEEARFVYLVDCNHSIEIEGLTYFMNLNEGSVQLKSCPKCKTVIRHCRRFNNVIRNRLQDVVKVKQRIFGNQKIIKSTQEISIGKLTWDDENWNRNLGTVRDYLLNQLVEFVPVRKGAKEERKLSKQVDEWTLSSINVILDFAEGALKVLVSARKELRVELFRKLQHKYLNLFNNIMKRDLPLSTIEIFDIGRELDRLFDLNQVYKVRSATQFTDGHPRAVPIYEAIMQLMKSPKPYTDTVKLPIRDLLTQIEEVLRTGLGISDRERREIVSALGMKQGHWYKCPNGHIYVITECGGANQISLCNECKAQIGGRNYRLVEGQQLATEMDGATGPSWPTNLLR